MYIIKYDQNAIYAGIYSNMDGNYCYDSNSINKKKPKVFKTLNGALNHIDNLINKVPYPDQHNFIIEEWSSEELYEHLISIGIDHLYERIKNQSNKIEKYWANVFKPIKGEIEVTKVSIINNVCTVTYLMPYSLYQNEFYFQSDLDKESVIKNFCDEVSDKADDMIKTIKESSSNVRNIF